VRREHKEGKTETFVGIAGIKQLTRKQLADLGSAALAFNVLDDQIDTLLSVAINLPDELAQEVTSRIHGIAGKTAILQKALLQSDLDPNDAKAAKESVDYFSLCKVIRDGMIHARIVDATLTIGLSEKGRGKKQFDILLTEEALGRLNEHMEALGNELSSLGTLLSLHKLMRNAPADDPNKERIAKEIQTHQAKYRDRHRHRRSLKPLPRFPKESELQEMANRLREAQAATLMGWYHQWPEPPARRLDHAATYSTGTSLVLPPTPDKKK
jgi:hypothetical protein